MKSAVEKDSKTLWTVIREASNEYWSHTNIGGLAQAYTAHGYLFRFVWLILFAYGFYKTIADVIVVVTDFLAHTHVSQIDVTHETTATFPAVTVCNQNRIDCEELLAAVLLNSTLASLRAVVNATNCLDRNGLECPYVWNQLVNVSLPNGFINTFKPHCLQCDKCVPLQNWLTNVVRFSGNSAEKLSIDAVINAIGCNSSCQRPSAGNNGRRKRGADGEVAVEEDAIFSADWTDSGRYFDSEGAAAFHKSKLPLSEVLRRRKKRQTAPQTGGGGAGNGASGAGIRPGGAGGAGSAGGPGGGAQSINLMRSGNQAFNDKTKITAAYLTLPYAIRRAIGAPFSELIMECSYQGISCSDERLFSAWVSPQYGNCYTFNSNISTTADTEAGKRYTTLTGELYSLSLLLYTKHFAYTPLLTSTKGTRLVIHNADEVPDVEEAGLDVLPHTSSSFSLEQKTISRLPSPYDAHCISDWLQVEFYPVVQNSTSITPSHEKYTAQRCKKICLQYYFQSKCACFHPYFPMPETISSRSQANVTAPNPCLLSIHSRDYNCTQGVLSSMISGNITCTCYQSCYEVYYDLEMSTTLWPRSSYLGVAASRMGIDIGDLTPGDLEKLASNILQVKIFFDSLNTEQMVQVPYISENSLLSALGGAMSLYLGISLIMVAEIVEYIGVVLWRGGKFVCSGSSHQQGRIEESRSPTGTKSVPDLPTDDMSKHNLKPQKGSAPSMRSNVVSPSTYNSPEITRRF